MCCYVSMKMGKSTTKNAEFDIEKIKRFTQKEFDKLKNTDDELPFCFQIGTDVLVGRYRVTKCDNGLWRVLEDDQEIFDFFTRKDAIFYCIAMHKQKLQLAYEIKEGDSLLNRLEFDASLYRVRFKKALEKGDDWGTELYSNRYTETMRRIEETKKEIKKNLELAKYIKV